MKPKVWIFSRFDGLLIIGAFIFVGFLFLLPSWNGNDRALRYMVQKKHEKAETTWQKALGKKPFSSLYRMNLALNYMLWNQPEKAIQEYKVTTRLLDKISSRTSLKEDSLKEDGLKKNNLKEKAFFNSAIASTQNQEVNRALGFYQQALLILPDSIETKTNIELLTQFNSSKSKDSKKEDKKSADKENKENKETDSQKDEEREKPDQEKEDQEKKDQEKPDQSNQKEEKQEEQKSQEEQNKEQKDGNLGEKEQKQEEQKGQTNQEKNQDKNREKLDQEKPDQGLNKKQTEAILRSIMEQEQNIKERRNQARKRRPVVEKDW